MKKSPITFLLILTVLLTALPPLPTTALAPLSTIKTHNRIWTEGLNNEYPDQAEMLNALGLFLGTDKGFELDKSLSRAEAAVLLVRFMGEEQAAEAQAYAHPFTDVPSWANPCVGWLYHNNITAGVSATEYGSRQPVTYWQFATLLNRICMGTDTYQQNNIGSNWEQTRIDALGFTRGDAVALLTRILPLARTKATAHSTDITVAAYLASKNVFTAAEFTNAARNIYSTQYHHEAGAPVQASIATIPCTQSRLAFDRLTTDLKTTPKRLLAQTHTSDTIIFYQLNNHTLKETEIGRIDWPYADEPVQTWLPSSANLYQTTYCLAMAGEQGARLARLDKDGIRTIAEGKSFGHPDSTRKFFTTNGAQWVTPDNTQADDTANDQWITSVYRNSLRLCIQHDDSIRVLSSEGMDTYPLPEGSALLDINRGIGVLYHEADGIGYIRGMDMATSDILDEYTVDLSDPRFDTGRTLLATELMIVMDNPFSDEGRSAYFGQAGLFAVHNKRLVHITTRPVSQVGYIDNGLLILTHDENEPLGAIYQYSAPDKTQPEYTEHLILSNNPPHGITNITSVYGVYNQVNISANRYTNTGAIETYTYAVSQKYDGSIGIRVTDFRPAPSPSTPYRDKLADPSPFIQREQERLNACGYTP